MQGFAIKMVYKSFVTNITHIKNICASKIFHKCSYNKNFKTFREISFVNIFGSLCFQTLYILNLFPMEKLIKPHF